MKELLKIIFKIFVALVVIIIGYVAVNLILTFIILNIKASEPFELTGVSNNIQYSITFPAKPKEKDNITHEAWKANVSYMLQINTLDDDTILYSYMEDRKNFYIENDLFINSSEVLSNDLYDYAENIAGTLDKSEILIKIIIKNNTVYTISVLLKKRASKNTKKEIEAFFTSFKLEPVKGKDE